jgi:hypothetical protein
MLHPSQLVGKVLGHERIIEVALIFRTETTSAHSLPATTERPLLSTRPARKNNWIGSPCKFYFVLLPRSRVWLVSQTVDLTNHKPDGRFAWTLCTHAHTNRHLSWTTWVSLSPRFPLPLTRLKAYSSSASSCAAPNRPFGTPVKTSNAPVPRLPSRPRTMRPEGEVRSSQSPSNTASLRKFNVVCFKSASCGTRSVRWDLSAYLKRHLRERTDVASKTVAIKRREAAVPWSDKSAFISLNAAVRNSPLVM